jgi:predicted O-linked N-acetylglucosamine transferase (SPINDLY family)
MPERELLPFSNEDFKSGNIHYNGQVLDVWAGILNDCPGSRLLVKSRGFAAKVAVSTFVERCAVAGIPSSRLLIRPPVKDTRGHLAVYNEVDIALDTFPYNGTTTTCEALVMGVPVVTFAGTRHSARVGASLLSAVGLPELCGDDVAAYSRIAAQLASDTETLRRIRSGLRKRMLGSSLCDAPAFTRGFEQLLAAVAG